MALGQYKIKVVPVLDTASLHNQLEQAGVKGGKVGKAGTASGEAYANSFSRALKERFKYSIANALIYGTQNAIKDAVQNVRELDKAQTELKKVTELTGKSLDDYTARAYKMGSTVAKTGTEIIQAATEFSKQGFDTESALQLSKVASEFQNIADTEIDAATAAKFINSQLKAFGNTEGFKNLTTDAEKAERVIDSVNEVANNFGVGTNDLQMALTKTGAALKGYGNSYSETIGLITAGTEMLPNQASKVARGWRTIGANILKLSQSEETLVAANGKVNISLRDSQGNMKSTFAILQDLNDGIDGQSVAWKDLSEEEQSNISLMLAGKTQTEVFKSTMDNYTQAIKANETAQKAQGSASRENAKYLDSIQGHIQTFQSAWEQLSYHLVNSDIIKSFIDLGTAAIKVVDVIIGAFDKLPGKFTGLAATLGTLFGAFVGGKKLLSIAEGFLGIGKAAEVAATATEAVGEAASAGAGAKGIGSLVKSLGALGSALLPIVPALIAVGGAFIYANYQYKNSFKGKLEEYEKLGNEITDLQSQIDALESKEGELTAEEESRLKILKMQLEILQRQEQLKNKQLTTAFDKDAKEKIRGKTHKVQGEDVVEREDLTGDKYIQAYEKRIELQKKINHLEEEARKHPLTKEQEKDLEKYNKELDKTYDNESAWLDKLIEEHDALANVDYSKLSAEGKTWYDNTHSAYLQALSDVESVRNAVGQAINTFGSAQFDAWDIDVSSLENAGDLVSQITQKISEMDDEEEVTIYARDETGNIIDEINYKKGELTDEEWELVVNATTTGDYDELAKYIEGGTSENNDVLINFIPVGLEEVEGEKAEATSNAISVLTYDDNGTIGQIQVSKIQAINPANGTITFDDNGTTKTIKASKIEAAQNASGSITFTSNIGSILSSIRSAIQAKKELANSATGKRKGEKGGLSWLGDEGTAQNPKPELVVGEDGAYLAGTQGWEIRNLKSTDTVYTYNQTKKLLGGKQAFALADGAELPRFKKGKKSKTQKISSKTKKKKQEEYDKKLKQLNHKRKVNHWTDKKYQTEYKKLYNKYKKYLTGDQSNDYTESREDYENERDKKAFEKEIETITPETIGSLINRINKNTNLDADEKAELKEKATEAANKVGHDRAEKEFDRRTGLISAIGTSGLSGLVKDVQSNQYLTADEKKDTIAKAYQTAVEYNLKEYQNGKATRNDILKDIQNYYNTRGQYDETYYKMVDELREADKQKELKRLDELEKKEANKLSYIKKYAQRQKDYYDDQIKKEQEEADALEKLVELQDQLNNAKKTMIKVYKEGEGFVYVQDTQAIKEAQKALNDYNKEQKKSELEEKAEAWQKILDAIGEAEDLSEMKELELSLGITDISQLTGNIGLDADKWGALAKIILATETGIADIAKILSDASGTDIEALIGATLSSGNKTISDALLQQYVDKHSFASGTLNSPSGFSLVGENGPELRYLSRGSAIFSNGISRNLMEWGQFSPAQVLNNMLGGSKSQVFNFDKIVLPNVHNADEFYRELQALPNRAIQQSAFRM